METPGHPRELRPELTGQVKPGKKTREFLFFECANLVKFGVFLMLRGQEGPTQGEASDHFQKLSVAQAFAAQQSETLLSTIGLWQKDESLVYE